MEKVVFKINILQMKRGELGWSQDRLCEEINESCKDRGISLPTIKRAEKYGTKVTYDSAAQIARALETPLTELVEDKDRLIAAIAAANDGMSHILDHHGRWGPTDASKVLGTLLVMHGLEIARLHDRDRDSHDMSGHELAITFVDMACETAKKALHMANSSAGDVSESD